MLVPCLKGEGQVSTDGDVAVTWFGVYELPVHLVVFFLFLGSFE